MEWSELQITFCYLEILDVPGYPEPRTHQANDSSCSSSSSLPWSNIAMPLRARLHGQLSRRLLVPRHEMKLPGAASKTGSAKVLEPCARKSLCRTAAVVRTLLFHNLLETPEAQATGVNFHPSSTALISLDGMVSDASERLIPYTLTCISSQLSSRQIPRTPADLPTSGGKYPDCRERFHQSSRCTSSPRSSDSR